MNYSKVYEQLIQKRRDNPITRNDCYCERHHIIPKSEGGANTKDNIINLTAREHYIAHLLLAKIYNDYKMWNAITSFKPKSDGQERHIRFNSRMFEKAKLIAAQMGSGEGNSMWGRHHSEETKEKMRRAAMGNQNMKGKHLSEEARRKLSMALKGKKRTEEQKRKMSLAMKGRKMSEEQKAKRRLTWMQRRKPIRRFTVNGTFIDEFQCADDAAKAVGTTSAAIRMCCIGNNKTCGGYVFQYVEDCENG